MVYILALIISVCLICGQALWGSAIKNIAPIGSGIATTELLSRLIQSPRLWFGAIFYAVGTIFYFLILSKVKFFSVQLTMTGLAIVFSVLISYFFFREPISIANFVGIFFVLTGVFLVMH